MDRIVVGNVRAGRIARLPPRPPPTMAFQDTLGGGEQVVGYRDGYPVVVRKPRGKYVYDVQTGAVKFEHELGPNAQEAANKIEASLQHLQETVKSLQKPAQKTAVIVAGTVAVGLVVAAVVYYMAKNRQSSE